MSYTEIRKFSITCPANYGNNKVSVIKAIRCLTGLGLKDAKDASELVGLPQTFEINTGAAAGTKAYLDEQFCILRQAGVVVASPIHDLIEGLRKIGIQALSLGEDEFANEVLQLVLVEKLRRKEINVQEAGRLTPGELE